MKQKTIVLMLASLIISCGSFNEGQAELHINKNISTGQELLDLKAALDEGIITKEEFDKLRDDIINGNQEFEIDIEEFENLDGDKSENVKIRININGNAITSTDSNGNIALTPAGTGEVDISKVDIADGEIDGTVIGANSAAAGTFAALQGTTVTASTNLTLASGATVTAILDEDDFSSDSATALATQQSIKAYITNNISSVTPTSTTTFTNKSLTAPVLTGSSSSAGSIIFKEDTDNGTNAVTLIGAADTADVTVTLPAVTGTIITTGNLTDFDVNSIAALSDPIANNDEILIHDTSGSVRKKATFTQIQTNLTSAGFSKDDPTALAIALG